MYSALHLVSAALVLLQWHVAVVSALPVPRTAVDHAHQGISTSLRTALQQRSLRKRDDSRPDMRDPRNWPASAPTAGNHAGPTTLPVVAPSANPALRRRLTARDLIDRAAAAASSSSTSEEVFSVLLASDASHLAPHLASASHGASPSPSASSRVHYRDSSALAPTDHASLDFAKATSTGDHLAQAMALRQIEQREAQTPINAGASVLKRQEREERLRRSGGAGTVPPSEYGRIRSGAA